MCGNVRKVQKIWPGSTNGRLDWTTEMDYRNGLLQFELLFFLFSCGFFHARMEQNGLYWNGQKKKIPCHGHLTHHHSWNDLLQCFSFMSWLPVLRSRWIPWISVGYIRSWICNSDYVVGAAWSDVQWSNGNGDTLGVVLLGRHVHGIVPARALFKRCCIAILLFSLSTVDCS